MIRSGLVRRVDDLGRIQIPKDIRKQLFNSTDVSGKPMEFFFEKDGTIIMKPVKDVEI